jgi:Uma2 family endonuclease
MNTIVEAQATLEEEKEGAILQMSYEEYLEWADEDVHAEWVDGQVIVHMPAKYYHQVLIDFLMRLIGSYVDIFSLGRLLTAPFEVKLWPGGPSREPDLLFVSSDHLDRFTDERLIGPADLIIEVVSRDSLRRDRVDKFDEYEAAGVKEYWILDNRPKRNRAYFYQLDESGQFQPITAGEGVYRSAVLTSFWLRLEWLWQEQPDALLALVEIVGLEKMQSILEQKQRALKK